jgi:nicotinamide-nucleotide amidase
MLKTKIKRPIIIFGFIFVEKNYVSYKSVIITIGDELLIGQTIDTNSAKLAQLLNQTGINLIKRIAIADEREAIITALDEYIPLVDLIILTGGLGPTADDITKSTLLQYFKGKLVLNERVQQHIVELFAHRRRPILQKNLDQALVPDNCKVLMNKMGTAPGMWFEQKNCIIISLPGVPFEMETIAREEVFPVLRERFEDEYILHKTLICMGKGESVLAHRIEDIEASLPDTISLSYLPSPGMVKLRLTTKGKKLQELQDNLDHYANLIETRLEKAIAASEDIAPEEIIIRQLKKHNLTLGTAESCSGGYIAHLLTNVPGCSDVFKGGLVTYSNNSKINILKVKKETINTVGAVSKETVIQMAENARVLLGVDIAVSVSGILGPGGATDQKPVGLVWIGLSNKHKTIAKEFRFVYDRIRNKEMTAYTVFNMIRLSILQYYNKPSSAKL